MRWDRGSSRGRLRACAACPMGAVTAYGTGRGPEHRTRHRARAEGNQVAWVDTPCFKGRSLRFCALWCSGSRWLLGSACTVPLPWQLESRASPPRLLAPRIRHHTSRLHTALEAIHTRRKKIQHAKVQSQNKARYIIIRAGMNA